MSMWRFQERVATWMVDCFGENTVAATPRICNFRFLEEALELVQAYGCTREEALQQIEYTFNRPKGEPTQEVGGVMVSLAVLCSTAGIDLDTAAHDELKRINDPEIMARVRTKQASKPGAGPLLGTETTTRKLFPAVIIDRLKGRL